MRSIRAIIAVSALIAAAGCATNRQPALETPPAELRILALGDSYTAGTAIPDGDAWPSKLATTFADDGTVVDLTVVAGEGWNTKRLDREIDRASIDGTFDVVILAIGVNDVILRFGIDNFREGLASLAEDVERRTGPEGTVVVLSIPDFRAAPWGQERLDRNYDVEAYNEDLGRLADDLGATFVDITTMSSAAVGIPRLMAVDGVHFSGAMHDQWVELIVGSLSGEGPS